MPRAIDFTKYKIRKCNSLHCCDVCGESITLGQLYYDGGYGRRAHVGCVNPPEDASALPGSQLGLAVPPEESLADIARKAREVADALEVRPLHEAIEALAQPIERCSLKHEIPSCPSFRRCGLVDIESGPPGSCYAAMVVDPAGDWVPFGHHAAFVVVFREALSHIAELCSAIETQSPSVTNEFVENARKRARDFLESVGR